MKKIIVLLLTVTLVALLSVALLVGCDKDAGEGDAILDSGEQIPSEEEDELFDPPYDYYEDDIVAIVLEEEYSLAHPQLDLHVFCTNKIGIEGEDQDKEILMRDYERFTGFHTFVRIRLSQHNKRHVLMAVAAWKKLDFVQVAEPKYIYGVTYESFMPQDGTPDEGDGTVVDDRE